MCGLVGDEQPAVAHPDRQRRVVQDALFSCLRTSCGEVGVLEAATLAACLPENGMTRPSVAVSSGCSSSTRAPEPVSVAELHRSPCCR